MERFGNPAFLDGSAGPKIGRIGKRLNERGCGDGWEMGKCEKLMKF
jgi:hypothetical protein